MAVKLAGRVARLTGAHVAVLHVMSQLPATAVLPHASPLRVMLQTPAPPDEADMNLGDLKATADQLIRGDTRGGIHLRQALEILEGMGVLAVAHVHHRLVIDEVVAESCEVDYDLVVVGAQPTEGWMRFLLNDIGHQIISCADRPVLVAKG